eukprot:TRINITY_DN23029_c0_g1_i5.p2 TRINITY_DN23029_c0_g1~~TRINITY_DN23029_c0_g1_i5.p2  ORF type:complete len:113 (-),score=12.08 TRINITY_DN23029_c0_g1_i5:307-645(-)
MLRSLVGSEMCIRDRSTTLNNLIAHKLASGVSHCQDIGGIDLSVGTPCGRKDQTSRPADGTDRDLITTSDGTMHRLGKPGGHLATQWPKPSTTKASLDLESIMLHKSNLSKT